MDPAWRDPDISKIAGSREGIAASGAPSSMPRPSPSMQESAADDPFSQLSLSRGPSGEALNLKRDRHCAGSLFLYAQHFIASQIFNYA